MFLVIRKRFENLSWTAIRKSEAFRLLKVIAAIFTPTLIVLIYMLNVKAYNNREVWIDIGTSPHEVEYTTAWRTKIVDLLDREGYKVHWTQDMPDVDTSYRLNRLVGAKGLLLIIGINNATATAGCHVFAKPMKSVSRTEDTLSVLLAERMMVALDTVIEVKSGTKAKRQDEMFLAAARLPAVLLEVGTLGKNPEIKTEAFVDKFSHAILVGVNSYYKSLKVINSLQEKKKNETDKLD